jgi:hypothetical protein
LWILVYFFWNVKRVVPEILFAGLFANFDRFEVGWESDQRGVLAKLTPQKPLPPTVIDKSLAPER